VLELFPETTAVERGELAVGGVRASALADELGTPLVAYCERTLVAAARGYREAAPGALLLYSVKAFRASPCCACSPARASARTSRR
jgi:diaminopimelate decarboxylase